MKFIKYFILLSLFGVYFPSAILAETAATQWAKSVVGGPKDSYFESVAVDDDGNIYAVGYITGNKTYNFGNGVSVVGAYSNGKNIAIVKYSSHGDAQWAKSVSTGNYDSYFKSVVLDNDGNIYAVGAIYVPDGHYECSYGFGNGIICKVSSYSDHYGYRPIIVKYNSTGNTQWAKSMDMDMSAQQNGKCPLYDPDCCPSYDPHCHRPVNGNSYFESVAVDANGNAYVVGSVYDNFTRDFGNNIKVAGGNSDRDNVVIIKYDSSYEGKR